MAGSLTPVMYWAVRTTLCSALRSEAEQLPYQAVMQPARTLSMVQLYHFNVANTPDFDANTIIKFADDTTVVGLIAGPDTPPFS